MEHPMITLKPNKVSIHVGDEVYNFKDAEELKDWALLLLEHALLLSAHRGPILASSAEEYAEMIRDEIAANPFLPSKLDNVLEEAESEPESETSAEDSSYSSDVYN
uniref:Uncharacterized protein n=1 Tax=Clandestinovirus TaxID=2831644 RepID=A0A8F8PK43_9VIRU|nr:hypothetical protein KOM_12_96 [Clandestinovirus]